MPATENTNNFWNLGRKKTAHHPLNTLLRQARARQALAAPPKVIAVTSAVSADLISFALRTAHPTVPSASDSGFWHFDVFSAFGEHAPLAVPGGRSDGCAGIVSLPDRSGSQA